jgi:hypothetical protein
MMGSVMGWLVLMVLAVIFMPFAAIWALNTLFGLGIEYTFWTWLSVVVINMFIQARITVKK